MARAKLTKRAVEAVRPADRDLILWDTELKGFGCKVTPKGKRVYFAYYRTREGQQRRPSIGVHGAMTCEQARETARQWLADRDRDPSGLRQARKSAPTVAEFAERYVTQHAEAKKSSKSTVQDRRMLERFVLPAFGKRKLAEVTRADVVKLHHRLKGTPYQANRVLALLSKMFNLAESWDLRPDGTNPCRHVEKYRERNRERFLSEAELARLAEVLAAAERTRIETPSVIAAIRLLLFTGARLSEILTLRWEHVDVEGQCLRLPDSKTGAKVVYLPPAALEILTALDRHEDNPYVIAGAKLGSHLINLQKPWRRIRAKAGLGDVRLHDLRHSFASMAVAGGLSLPVIGALLGHTQPATTARYAHLADDPLKQAANLTGARIAAAMKQGVQAKDEGEAAS